MAIKKKVDFEVAVKRLDEIVSLLERNPSSLDEAVALYKEGKEMLEICQEKLEKAEGEILKYSGNGNSTVSMTNGKSGGMSAGIDEEEF